MRVDCLANASVLLFSLGKGNLFLPRTFSCVSVLWLVLKRLLCFYTKELLVPSYQLSFFKAYQQAPFIQGVWDKRTEVAQNKYINLPKSTLQLEDVKGRKEGRFNIRLVSLVTADWELNGETGRCCFLEYKVKTWEKVFQSNPVTKALVSNGRDQESNPWFTCMACTWFFPILHKSLDLWLIKTIFVLIWDDG